MSFCPICNSRIQPEDTICTECGTSFNQAYSYSEVPVEESFELRPRFVFVYELLPSSIKTVWMLCLLLVASIAVRDYFHLPPTTVVAFFAFLLLLKDFEIFSRKFRYRNVKYIISSEGIEYSNMSKNITYFIPYDKIRDIKIQRNFATTLFGYGHILVKDRESGIYLDYIADVEKVYDYICEHMDR